MTKTWAEVWEFRSSLYTFFANVLLEPIDKEKEEVFTTKFWQEFPLEMANADLQQGLEKLQQITATFATLSQEEVIEKVMVEYTELFLGPGRPLAPPIESFYRSNKKLFFGDSTIKMKEKLNKFGIESRKKDRQPEDHLDLELLFLAVQTEKLIDESSVDELEIIKEQLDFIENHLLSWLPELCSDAEEHGSVGFYSGLFKVISGAVKWDEELLEEFMKNNEQRATTI